MKNRALFLSAAVALFLAGGPAFAGCVDISENATDGNRTAAIAKDGSKAPLEARSGTADKVAKDGRTVPLADEQGGGDKNTAMSQQDVEAQQEGKQTAAASSGKGSCN